MGSFPYDAAGADWPETQILLGSLIDPCLPYVNASEHLKEGRMGGRRGRQDWSGTRCPLSEGWRGVEGGAGGGGRDGGRGGGGGALFLQLTRSSLFYSETILYTSNVWHNDRTEDRT